MARQKRVWKIDYLDVHFASYHYHNLKRLAMRLGCSERDAPHIAIAKILSSTPLPKPIENAS